MSGAEDLARKTGELEAALHNRQYELAATWLKVVEQSQQALLSEIDRAMP